MGRKCCHSGHALHRLYFRAGAGGEQVRGCTAGIPKDQCHRSGTARSTDFDYRNHLTWAAGGQGGGSCNKIPFVLSELAQELTGHT